MSLLAGDELPRGLPKVPVRSENSDCAAAEAERCSPALQDGPCTLPTTELGRRAAIAPLTQLIGGECRVSFGLQRSNNAALDPASPPAHRSTDERCSGTTLLCPFLDTARINSAAHRSSANRFSGAKSCSA